MKNINLHFQEAQQTPNTINVEIYKQTLYTKNPETQRQGQNLENSKKHDSSLIGKAQQD